MLLVLDIGNTEITVGLYRGDDLVSHWRLTTTPERTPDEWSADLGSFLMQRGHSPSEVRAACLASVVPPVTRSVADGVESATGQRAHSINARTPLPLTLDVDEPFAVGADRIVNILGALDRYPGDCIVVDFGTATTFDCVTADRRFIGGSIMPGLRTSADQLVRKAAKLTATELRPPARAIGRTTEEHIQGGVLFGAADSVDGMVRRLRAEWPGAAGNREEGTGNEARVVATGGLSVVVAPLCTSVDVVDADLTLHGLKLAARHVGLHW
ncbi:MAG TPA: type III pantothenate kinase [Candidatus Limnocylindria bacterium]|jgi:type III pantothenate kinase|nr:type III pantothenate kinase [Candidatus Limnocylindria bacterium]